MSTRSDTLYLGDMLDYSRRASAKVTGLTLDQWNADETLQLAVAYLVQIIGEAASRLPESTRESLPHLPWRDMIGTRHRLVHGYGQIKFEIIWNIVTNDLPPLIETLEKILTPPEPPSA